MASIVTDGAMHIMNDTGKHDRYSVAKRNQFVEGSLRDADSRISASNYLDTGSKWSQEEDRVVKVLDSGALWRQIGTEIAFNK